MTLYSNNCPKCNQAKATLKSKDVLFNYVDDYDTVIKKAQEVNIMEMPLLEVDGSIYSGTQAVRYAKGL